MQPHTANAMPLSAGSVTSSRFERRLPAGRLEPVFKPLGTDAAIARQLRVSKMTVWRWRHDRAPLPKWVADLLPDIVQQKVTDVLAARDALHYFRALPPRPPRALSGCCAGRKRAAPARRRGEREI